MDQNQYYILKSDELYIKVFDRMSYMQGRSIINGPLVLNEHGGLRKLKRKFLSF